MKYINTLTIMYIFSLLVSCKPTNADNEKSPAKENSDTVAPTLQPDTVEYTPSLILFEQNDCKSNNEKGEKIIKKHLQSDTLSIKITSVQDCGTKYGGAFKFYGDTIDLLIKQLPRIIKHKNGKIDSIYESQECYCLYQFLFKINHIDTLPKAIILNGRNFRGEWKGL